MEIDGLHLTNLKYKLFANRRFLPMFLAVFLGTLNDNIIRAGLIVMIAYAAQHNIALSTKPEILVTICSGLLVLPMVLFSSIAGQLADKYEKSRLVVFTKFAEIFIMLAASYGFYYHNITLLMFLLFISGTHSAFAVPIKFSILPQHLKPGELLAGNAFIASGSYLAILAGMIVGGLIIEAEKSVIGITITSVAIIGFVASLFIPPALSSHPETKVSFNLWQGTVDLVRYVRRDGILVRTILALSWGLNIGTLYISQFANYAHSAIHADNEVYIVFLTIFSVGMAIGSILCDTLLKSQISSRFSPIAAIGMAVFTALMVFFTTNHTGNNLMNIGEFFSVTSNLLVVSCMLLVAMCGGIYMVPLYALLQSRTSSSHRSQVIAVSNLSDSVSITITTIISAILLSYGLTVQDLFIIIAFMTIAVAWYARKIDG